MPIKIATLNLCLGLKNKKDLIRELISENKIDILCAQEIEVHNDVPRKILSIKGFNFEVESNSKKARVGLYIKNNMMSTMLTDHYLVIWKHTFLILI